MDDKLEIILVRRFPKIFKDYGGDYRYTCMAWGFECGDGWFSIIYEACYNTTQLSKGTDLQVVASQVKQKFGGLRFYYSIEGAYTPLSKLFAKLRNFIFSLKLGVHYWKIVDFRKKFWKSIPEKISDAIDYAENKSYKTCESCGAKGSQRGGFYIYTFCDGCERKVIR